MLEVICCLSLA